MLKYLSKFFYVLAEKKINIILLVGLFILTSVFDALGIGLIGPFIGLATNPNLIEQNSFLHWCYLQSGVEKTTQFVALVGLAVTIIFYIKSYLYFRVQESIYKFAYAGQQKLRLRLMKNYLTVPYTFHLNTNTALLIQNIVNEALNFCIGILIPLLLASANFVVILSLVLLLAVTSLSATVSILGVFILTLGLYSLFKNKIARWGRESSESSTEMIRIVNHAMGGLKETRVIGCESYFEDQFNQQITKYANSASLSSVFQFLPRIALESLLITFVVGFTCVSQLFFNQSPQSLISVLGVFAIASIRLMPAASQFISALGLLRQYQHTLDMLYFDLKQIENLDHGKNLKLLYGSSKNSRNNSQVMPFTKEIVLDRVTYSYPQSSDIAIQNISLTIKKGQSIALIGKSGAGKTTLADVILGLLVADNGDIRVDGESIYENGIRSWQNLIGYIPQSIFLTDDTVERNIAFGVPDDLIDSQKVEEVIQTAQLTELINSLPEGIRTPIGERGVRLSGGQRQRIGIARALYHEREILVMDEATSALDSQTESLVSEAIKSLSGTKTIIIIAHRLTTVEHCDCIYMLEKGRVINSGTYQEVILEKQT